MPNLALVYDILAKDRASKTFDKVGDSAQSAGKRGGMFGGALKGAMGLVGGALAGVGLVEFFQQSNAEARESQKVNALTAAVLKSTGGAAKVTAGQVGDLAMAISNKTGIDDEQIQSSANMLLTFTNVRNEVGKGNDIFSQATQTVTDMSAALGQDGKNSAIQLGKALNDPIKGITALQRVGVTFSDEQKKQIGQMVSHNNTLGAQKVILKELNREFGGAAASQATAGQKLQTVWKNFQEQIGTALLPVIDKVASFLGDRVLPAVSGFITQMQNGTGAGGQFVDFFKGLWSVVQAVGGFFMGTLVPAFRTVWQVLSDFISGFTVGTDAVGSAQSTFAVFGATLYSTLIPAFQAVWTFIRTRVVPAFMGIVSAVRGFVAVALPIVQAFVAGMMARIGPMMPQIRVIFAQIGSIIVSVMGLIQAIIQRVTAIIGGIWSRWGKQIMDFAAAVFRTILAVISGALNIIAGVVRTVTALIHGDWSGAWDGIKQIVSGAVQVIQAVVSGAMTLLRTIMSAAWSGIKTAASAAWGGIKSAVSTGIGNVIASVEALPGQITGALGSLGSLLLGAGQALIQGLIDGIMSKVRDVTGAVSSIASTIRGFFPGSPVKTGPLTSWNNGGAGRRLGDMLAAGLDASVASVSASSRNLAAAVVSPIGSAGAGGYGALGAGGPLVHIEHMTVRDEEEAARRIEAKQRDAMAVYNLAGV